MENEIISLYRQNVSIMEITKKYHISSSSLFRILNKTNEPRHHARMSLINISSELKSDIINLYIDGLSIHKISKHLSIDRRLIAKLLKNEGISQRNKSQSRRQYTLDETYFDNISNEYAAYFLGLLYADGCNSLDRRRIEIALQEGDHDILEKFNIALNHNKKLVFHDAKGVHKNHYRLTIGSKYMAYKLNELGCVPAKSLKLTFPEWLTDDDLIRHFIRGYFDGDGSLYCSIKKNKKTPTFGWSIVSTKLFCHSVSKILEEKLGVHFYMHASSSNGITHSLRSGGNLQVHKIMTWLYRDASIFIIRKHDKYLELSQINANRKRI